MAIIEDYCYARRLPVSRAAPYYRCSYPDRGRWPKVVEQGLAQGKKLAKELGVPESAMGSAIVHALRCCGDHGYDSDEGEVSTM